MYFKALSDARYCGAFIHSKIYIKDFDLHSVGMFILIKGVCDIRRY